LPVLVFTTSIICALFGFIWDVSWHIGNGRDPGPLANPAHYFIIIGLFGIFELIRNRKTRQPMAPFNGTSEEMAALGKFFREQGLYTLVRWNTFFTNPPLCINEQQLREAFAIIDKGLEITDKAVID